MKTILTLVMATLAAGFAHVASAAQTAVQAASEFDHLVGDYNLISLGNATFQNYGDTEGMLAIGGDLTISSGLIASKADFASASSYANPSLYVNGAYNPTGTVSIKNGYAYLPNASSTAIWSTGGRTLTDGSSTPLTEINSNSPTAAVDPRSATLNPNWNFGALQNSFESISSTFAGAAVTGQITVVGQTLELTPITAGQSGAIIFNLDMNLLSGNTYNGQMFSNVQFDVATGCDYIVNVLNADGRTLFGYSGGINFNQSGSSDYNRLLWNIVDDTGTTNDTVTIGNGGQFYGAILAPTYEVKNGAGTAINGQVVAGSVAYDTMGNAELHFTGFDDVPETPEASTWGLLGGALCLGFLGLRRLQQHSERHARARVFRPWLCKALDRRFPAELHQPRMPVAAVTRLHKTME